MHAFQMMRTGIVRLAEWSTGRISHETKLGRLAKLFRTEILGKDKRFDFQAFGDMLIGTTVKALSIAQSSKFDDLEPLTDMNKRILFVPCLLDTPEKSQASVASIRLLISARSQQVDDQVSLPSFRVASTSDPVRLAKRMHEVYLKGNNGMILRTMGTQQSAIAVRAIATFNEKVESHKLQSYLSAERVDDEFKKESTGKLRTMLFHVDVVPSNEVEFPE